MKPFALAMRHMRANLDELERTGRQLSSVREFLYVIEREPQVVDAFDECVGAIAGENEVASCAAFSAYVLGMAIVFDRPELARLSKMAAVETALAFMDVVVDGGDDGGQTCH